MSNKSPLHKLESFGQSVWIDYIERDFFFNNKLKHMINEYDLRGMTSNPSIFEKAITSSSAYDTDIKKLKSEGKDAHQIYQELTIKDVQSAADVFRPLYDATKGLDGYVSLEVNPHLANDTPGTIEEARMLWKTLNRPNVFIKVPATRDGLPAIQQLIADGINVNVTLLFSVPRYKEVVDAYLAGLENRLAENKDIRKIRSVASFFISRIDALLDPLLEKHMNDDRTECGQYAQQAHGQIATSSAKIAYTVYQRIVESERFKNIQQKGGHTQRLLWASTSTKNPKYSDVKYVEALIGPDTVNTLPLETIEAYYDHGEPQLQLTKDVDFAKQCLEHLDQYNIDLNEQTQTLEAEGVEKFIKSYDELIKSLENKMSKI